MKLFLLLLAAGHGLLLPARADIQTRLSVKFIRNNNAGNTRPAGPVGNATGFGQEVTRGNGILEATTRGYSMNVVEYLDITPPPPAAATANVTGGTTNGSARVTCSNTAGLQPWMRVQGTGIPANTVIESIVANTSFFMSLPATVDLPSVAITASSTTSASVTGGTTSASATVTCTNTSDLQPWMRVQGPGIPGNTVILDIYSNVAFTMSNNASATAGSVTVSASFPADHWYNLPARAARQYLETTALAAQTVWRWNPNAINIYVNNSSSGQCTFVGTGGAITLGSTVGTGTVLHEIGHFFDLFHTHDGDYADQPGFNNPAFVYQSSHLTNGDGLAETANDNPNISTRDQLSIALYGKPYFQPAAPPNAPFADATQRAAVDSAFLNVMSYHAEDVLLPDQMDKWTLNANGLRLQFCTGRTWFLANGGNDGGPGSTATQPLATVAGALGRTLTVNDVLLLRAGNYTAPATQMTTPCTLHATRGQVTLTR